MNKYGYDKSLESYIKLCKVGYKNRESISTEWIYALELPATILIFHYRLSGTVVFYFLSVVLCFLLALNYL